MADLQELFSRLKSPAASQQNPTQSNNYQPPAVSSPLFSPPISTPNPTGSGILSPQSAPTPAQDAKAASLLNLLRFNGQPTQQSSPLANLQNISSPAEPSNRAASNSASNVFHIGGSNVKATHKAQDVVPNPQDFLLNLLKQPSSVSKQVASSPKGQEDTAPQQQHISSLLAHASAELDASQATTLNSPEANVRQFGSAKSRETTPFEVNSPSKSNGIFTYVNPFEQLSASTPTKRTPQAQTEPAPHSQAKAGTPEPESLFGNGQQHGSAATVPDVSIKQEKQETDLSQVPETWQNSDVQEVRVYNLPMKPFVSIQVNPGHQASRLRTDNLMDISRLKKDFDQIDRSLATASASHIVYALAKSGGFRLIRQDTGRDKHAFKSNQERIFHVQINQSSVGSSTDCILAAGVDGSVFWTTIELGEEDKFADENLEANGFILPPLSAQEENTSGSPIKTRSKMSSRHSDLFALSRGKAIHVVAPKVAVTSKYMDTKTRVIDSAKFFQERSHKITTGKACKDFAFSEDDSIIASLDKAGRIRFWNIKELAEAARATKKSSIELKTPLLTFTASMASEKISPTSVMFLDKDRPCSKGVALRYLLVGFKQNHVIQLWDLGLGKPVQELHFPHEKDSDAICSISYSPKTGIISLTHPTRNSIYLIHLSAPRYHIPNMDQAKYLSMIADEDPTLPKPESTAIMSGIRELSFGSKGQLRSVDMLTTPAPSNNAQAGDETLFELYAMHSLGVTCIGIKQEDLGWDKDNSVLHPLDAEKVGYVTISSLAAPQAASAPSDATPTPKPKAVQTAQRDEAKQSPAPTPKAATPARANGTSTTAKPQIEAIIQSIEQSPQPQPPMRDAAKSQTTNTASTSGSTPSIALQAVPAKTADGRAADSIALVDRTKNGIVGASSDDGPERTDVARIVNAGFESLTKRLETDRRVQDAAANARQDAVLNLVSSVLTDNVEASLGKIVSSSLQQEVLPSVAKGVAAVAERQIPQQLNDSIGKVVPREIKAALPAAISAALRDPETARLLTDPITAQLSKQILQVMEGAVRKTIAPILSQTIPTSVQKAMADYVQSQSSDRVKEVEALTSIVHGLEETVKRMAAQQDALHERLAEVLESERPASGGIRATSGAGSVVVAAPPARSPAEEELDDITSMMTEGKFEEGTIRWLQSTRQAELFDGLFVRVNPQYLQKLSPLVKLSVSAAVSTSFDQNVEQRLDWLGTILSTTDLQDGDIAQVAPKIMNVLLSRIQGAYMSFAEVNPADPLLRKFSNLSRQITDIRRLLG